MKRVKMIISIFIIMYVGRIYGINSDSGTAGMQFLKIPADASSSGRGSAVVASVGGIESLYWNPAGLNSIEGKELLLSYNSWIGGMNYIYAGFGMPLLLKFFGRLGGSITYMGEGGIDDISNSSINSASSYDLCISIGYGLKISRIRLGGVLRYIHRSIFGYSSDGGVLDIGGQYDISRNIRVGTVIKNLGFASKVYKKPESMPITYMLGGAYIYEFEKVHHLAVDIGVGLITDEDPSIGIGVEYGYNGTIFIRGGYKISAGGSELGGKGLSVGVGGKISIINVDISWLPYGVLGNVVQSSLKVKF